MDYAFFAQHLYLAAMMIIMGWSVVRCTLRPRLLADMMRAESLPVWLVACGLVVLGLPVAGFAFLMEGQSAFDLLGPVIMMIVLMFLVSLAAYPVAVEGDHPKRRKILVELPLFALLTLGWSFLSLIAFTEVVEVEVSEEFFLRDLQERPWAQFVAVFIFVLVLALLEELVFRGGIQGALERTRLGVPGAIVVAALVWSLGHVGYLDTIGVKELQIFGLGIIFGVVKARLGLKWAAALHLLNNFAAMGLAGVDRFVG